MHLEGSWPLELPYKKYKYEPGDTVAQINNQQDCNLVIILKKKIPTMEAHSCTAFNADLPAPNNLTI